MNENDLTIAKSRLKQVKDLLEQVWQDGHDSALESVKANPWQLFENDLELINLVFARADSDMPCGLEERQLQLWDEIKAELERRKQ